MLDDLGDEKFPHGKPNKRSKNKPQSDDDGEEFIINIEDRTPDSSEIPSSHPPLASDNKDGDAKAYEFKFDTDKKPGDYNEIMPKSYDIEMHGDKVDPNYRRHGEYDMNSSESRRKRDEKRREKYYRSKEYAQMMANYKQYGYNRYPIFCSACYSEIKKEYRSWTCRGY
jgi:hypothetical protein